MLKFHFHLPDKIFFSNFATPITKEIAKIMIKYSVKEKDSPVDVLEEELKDENHLVVFNDEVNTFDFVIESLIKVCQHDPIQAEQCTFIIHFNGKCSVKDGSYNKLRPMCEALLDRGLSATID